MRRMILIDSREPKEIDRLLQNLPIKRTRLSSADYIINATALERKTLADFFQSAKHGRLFFQVKRRSLDYPRKILLIEDFLDFSYVINPEYMYRILQSITIDLNVEIIF